MEAQESVVRSDGTRYPSSAERTARWKALDPDKPLTKRERVIVAEFAKDLNLSAAVKRAGQGGKHPDRRAYELKLRANVAKAIENVIIAREKASEVTVERLMQRWADYAFVEQGKIAGPIQHNHVQNALEHLGKLKGAYKPEQQTVVPVIFQFVGAPALPTDGNLVIEARVQAEAPQLPPAASPEAPGPRKR